MEAQGEAGKQEKEVMLGRERKRERSDGIKQSMPPLEKRERSRGGAPRLSTPTFHSLPLFSHSTRLNSTRLDSTQLNSTPQP